MKFDISGGTPRFVDNPSCSQGFKKRYPQLFEMQAFVYERFFEDEDNCLFLTAPTASGKTLAISAPIFDSGTKTVFVYPFRALTDDQNRQLSDYAGMFGFTKDDFTIVMGGVPTRDLLKAVERGRFLLSTPDKLVTLFSGGRNEQLTVLSLLRNYQFVFDEIHTYNPLMLQSIIYFLRTVNLWNNSVRAHFISATFHEDYQRTLEEELRRLHLKIVKTPEEICVGYTGDAHVTIQPFKNSPESIAKDIEKPNTVAIFNTAIKAWRVERALRRRGASTLLYVGQEKMSEKKRTDNLRFFRASPDKWIFLGSPAVECGVDFTARNVFLEETSAGATIQRFGRGARQGAEGNIVIYSDRLKTEEPELTRREFETLVWRSLESPAFKSEFAGLAAYPYYKFFKDESIIEKDHLDLCRRLEEKGVPSIPFFRGFQPSLRYETGESISLRALCWKRLDLTRGRWGLCVKGSPAPDRFFMARRRRDPVTADIEKLVLPVPGSSEPVFPMKLFGKFKFHLDKFCTSQWTILEVSQDKKAFRNGDENIALSKGMWGRFYGVDL